jgi:hypothetical protein
MGNARPSRSWRDVSPPECGGRRAWSPADDQISNAIVVQGTKVFSAGLAEDAEQRLARAAQAVVDPLAAAVRLDQSGCLEPREVGRDRRGAQAELVGEFGCGARCGEKALQHGRPPRAQGCLQRRTVGCGGGSPQARHPAGTVGQGRPVPGLDEHLHAGPGEDARHQGYPTSCGRDDGLVDLVQLQGAPAVAGLRMQSGEQCLDAAYGESLPALELVALKVFVDPGPVRGERQGVVASQFVHQPLQGALRIAQVDLQQACLFGREEPELSFSPRTNASTSSCTTSGGVVLKRSSSSPKLAAEASGGGVMKSGQRPATHMAATSTDRSVPGTTRRVRVTHDACTVSVPWCSSTAKLATVSYSGLGAMRTLVRSSVVRGIVIMAVQPSSNSTHSRP